MEGSFMLMWLTVCFIGYSGWQSYLMRMQLNELRAIRHELESLHSTTCAEWDRLRTDIYHFKTRS